MASQEEVKLIIKAATDQAVNNLNKLNTSLGKTEKQGGKLKNGLTNLKSSWLGMTAAIVGATVAIKKLTNAASDLEESQNKFNEVFKKSDKALAIANKGLGELNEKYAMSQREAAALTSTIGALLQPMGYLPEEAATASIQITKLAADLGSFNNVPTADALNAIRSALVGEVEPMRRFGVQLNEVKLKAEAANQGFKVGKGILESNAKAHAALAIIMKETTLAQGDMIRTSEGYANKAKAAEAASEDMTAALGTVLLPAMVAIQGALASTFKLIAKLSDGWRTAIVSIGLASVVIAVLTKVVIAFGVSLSAAIWPVTLIVAAIVGAIAIVKNWETVVWALKVAWEAVKFAFNVVVQSLKIGMAAINVAVSKAVEIIATPFLNAINLVIEGMNKLPGVDIEVLDNIFQNHTEHNEKMLELELKKLADLEMADVEHKEKKEVAQTAHQNKMNQIVAAGETKKTSLIKKSEMDLALDRDKKRKDELKKQIDYNKLSYQIDKELLSLKIQNRGLDTQSMSSAWNFALSALDTNSKKQFKIWKAMSIANALVATYQAAINAYNALAGIPVVGPGLGVAAGIAATSFGLLRVNNIKNTKFQGAEEGAIIRGTPGASGTLVRAGENNKDEAIIPLEDSDITERIGNTVNINIDTAVMDEDFSQDLAIRIDNALYNLDQAGLRKS